MKQNKRFNEKEKFVNVISWDIATIRCRKHKHLLHRERKTEGFFLGTIRVWGRNYYIVKPKCDDSNILIVGGTSSGKSSCIAMQALTTWTDSIVAVDIKGELSSRYEQLLKEGKVKRPFIRFNPMDMRGWGYGPQLRKCGKEQLPQGAREIALSIMNENTNATMNDTQTAGENAGKNEPVFSQEELNRILGERLHKERLKMENELTDREKAVAQKEYHAAALDVLKNHGAHFNASEPLEILSVLNATTAGELDKAINIINKAFGMKTITVGAGVATPPKADFRRDDDADIRKAMGIKK